MACGAFCAGAEVIAASIASSIGAGACFIEADVLDIAAIFDDTAGLSEGKGAFGEAESEGGGGTNTDLDVGAGALCVRGGAFLIAIGAGAVIDAGVTVWAIGVAGAGLSVDLNDALEVLAGLSRGAGEGGIAFLGGAGSDFAELIDAAVGIGGTVSGSAASAFKIGAGFASGAA